MDDNTRQMVGIILIAVGFLDPVLGFFVLAPRVPDENKKKVVVMALVGSGLTMMAVGALILAGLLG